jgi:hypothetical protein
MVKSGRSTYISILSFILIKFAFFDLFNYPIELLTDYKVLCHICTQNGLNSSLFKSSFFLHCQPTKYIVFWLGQDPLQEVCMIIFQDCLVITGCCHWMLDFLIIHIIEPGVSSVMSECADHGREHIHVLNNISYLGLTQNQISHVHDVESMSEVVVRYPLHMS